MKLFICLLLIHNSFINHVISANANEELYTKLFKIRRAEQLQAVKSMHKKTYAQQYKLIALMAEQVFTVIKEGKLHWEASNYKAGFDDNSNDTIKEALSKTLESTALFSEMLLRLPDITSIVLKTNKSWNDLLHWSLLSFSKQMHGVLDLATIKMLHLVSQELNYIERDPDYHNPYKKIVLEPVRMKKEHKKTKKGPRLFVNEL